MAEWGMFGGTRRRYSREGQVTLSEEQEWKRHRNKGPCLVESREHRDSKVGPGSEGCESFLHHQIRQDYA